jgi:hypothetical protein
MIKPLEYYFVKKGIIEHVIFNKYTIDEYGIVRNEKGEVIIIYKNGKYNALAIRDDGGKIRSVNVGRAIASTFIGPPPTPKHTADHINNKLPDYDALTNIRWLCKSGQNKNRDNPGKLKAAFIIVKNGLEKTAKDWVEHLKGEKNSYGSKYTTEMITQYAQKKQHGFAYKEYPDLLGEVWKEIIGSTNVKGRWEISNMNRLKWITKYAENVLCRDRIGLNTGYPIITINKKKWLCHILSFMTFFPEEYAMKKQNEMVLHEDDDPMDFRPHKLRLGTRSENGSDAYKNGKHDGTKTARMSCSSYIKGVFEKEHESQEDAARYLKTKGYDKAIQSKISMVLSGNRKTAYDRVWEKL